MKISIFGMGYVGVVSGACLLRDGHQVVGVDPVASKVQDLADGRTPIQEPGVPEMLAEGHRAGRLSATTNSAEGLSGCDMVWICVGTPSDASGGLKLTYVEAAIGQIADALKASGERPLIVLRSTCLPGTTREVAIPLLEERSGLKVGRDLSMVFHPEFLREGTAVMDFDDPPKIVVGEANPGAADLLMELYEKYPASRFRLELGEAEMVKYCDNLFHALKITFANEVAAVARSVGLDARRVAEVYCADKKLNISEKYLRPGFAYGGSCLPKDLRAILRFASVQSLRLPMLEGILASNSAQIDDLVRRVLAHQPRTVGMVGLAFKPDTDDMRESPHVTVAKALIGEGIELRIHDPGVQPERLLGSNKEQVQRALRHLEELLVASLDELDGVDLVLVNHPRVDAERVSAWLAAGTRVVDLAGVAGINRSTEGYEGIAW